MVLTKTQIENNVMFGLAFGYPTCCIEHFNIRQLDDSIFNDDTEDDILSNTGFICCKRCNQSKNAFQMMVEIAGRRKIKTRFPMTDTSEIQSEINDEDKFLINYEAIPIVQRILKNL